MSKKFLIPLLFFEGVCLAVLAAIAALFCFFALRLNNPPPERYPVRGVDVSSYQGNIDWNVLSSQGISFAFIKATEGSRFTDPDYAFNLKSAVSTGLRVGSYHFFSFDSSGGAQADHFCSVVPKTERMLPPVIDVEFYGDKEKNPPDKAEVQKELQILSDRLKEYYGTTPILYATETAYSRYLAGSFEQNDIWIRNVFFAPALPDHRQWTFWQYTDRAVLRGYHGTEKCIDLNVFCGSAAAFDTYCNS